MSRYYNFHSSKFSHSAFLTRKTVEQPSTLPISQRYYIKTSKHVKLRLLFTYMYVINYVAFPNFSCVPTTICKLL